MLYRPEAFERLTGTPWDDGRVCAAIVALVADADDAWRGPRLLWRADPWDGWHSTSRAGARPLLAWTGDLGVAVYAADCLDATAGYPVLSSRST